MKMLCVLAISSFVGLVASAPPYIPFHVAQNARIEYPDHDKYLQNVDFLKFIEELYKVYQGRVHIPNVNHASISPSPWGQVNYAGNPFLSATVGKAIPTVVPKSIHHIPDVTIAPRVLVPKPIIPDVPVLVEDPEEAKEQARSAKYAFSTDVQDGIQDGSLQRQEVRDGLALKGAYSYSDGFYKRTVQYEADENGYRVINEEVIPIGQGPKVNIDGAASVATKVAGSEVAYKITKDDINYNSTETANGAV